MLSPLQLTNVTSRRPKGAFGGHEVSASRAAQASEARLYYIKRRVKLITSFPRWYSKLIHKSTDSDNNYASKFV